MFCARRWFELWFVTWLLLPAVVGGDDGMQSVSFREIKDDAVKSRIVTFIEDVSGVTVARQG